MKTGNDFVSIGSTEKYQYKLGRSVASALSGFIAGVIVASIVWSAVAYFANIAR